MAGPLQRSWWVNQNQTYAQEFAGGYLWSPKLKANGHRNPYYEFMREVAPGDRVYCFAEQRIKALGSARSYAYEAPKPEEFGSAGRNWSAIGWRVDVDFQPVDRPFRPVDRIEQLRPLLPKRYAPLSAAGRGSQSIYLTELPPELAQALAQMLGPEAQALARSELSAERVSAVRRPELLLWEEHLRAGIASDPALGETEKQALILARRGQGRFREAVQTLEHHCRVTRVERPEHLRASHCKPWRDATNAERLDPENGLLLTPSVDHLFDRGFLAFANDGRLLLSPVAHRESLAKMGIPVERDFNVGSFSTGQKRFLEYHRDAVFLRARVQSA